VFLEAFRRRRDARTDDAFPWTVPALRDLRELRFTGPVTFLWARTAAARACVFFRAEDAFGFTRRIAREMKEIDADADAMLCDEKASEFRRRLGASSMHRPVSPASDGARQG
jgi:predicted ATPase